MASRGFIELLRLADLAKARQTGRNSPDHEHWQGVAFEVAGERFIAPIGEISEVLAMPDLTPMPLTKAWLLGVANVRGRLLPLTDLAGFLGLASDVRQKDRKVLVVDHSETFAGLLVDQVLGIMRFVNTQYVPEELPIESAFVRYHHGKFICKEGEDWHIFMPSLLVNDERFMDAASD